MISFVSRQTKSAKKGPMGCCLQIEIPSSDGGAGATIISVLLRFDRRAVFEPCREAGSVRMALLCPWQNAAQQTIAPQGSPTLTLPRRTWEGTRTVNCLGRGPTFSCFRLPAPESGDRPFEWHHLELIFDLQQRVVQRDVVLEDLGNCGLFEIACHGHSGSQAPQSMHSSGSM